MGILLNGLGNLSGKIGDVVFKQRGGKTFIAKAPKRKSNYVSPETKKRRDKFAVVGQIAKVINSVPQLKEIWGYSCKKNNSPYNKIFKNIYTKIHEDDFTKFGGIIPDWGENLLNCRFIPLIPKIIIELIGPADAGKEFTDQEVFIRIAGIVVLTEPRSVGDKPIQIIGINSGIDALSMEFPREINYGFGGSELQMIVEYTKREYYLHLLTLDESGKVVRYSEQIKQSTI